MTLRKNKISKKRLGAIRSKRTKKQVGGTLPSATAFRIAGSLGSLPAPQWRNLPEYKPRGNFNPKSAARARQRQNMINRRAAAEWALAKQASQAQQGPQRTRREREQRRKRY